MSLTKWIKYSIVTEVVGISLVSSGIIYEMMYAEPIGFMLITAGSMAFAVGSGLMIKARKLFGAKEAKQ